MTRDLLAYSQLILQLARQHGGGGWIAYNSHFRQQAAASATIPWSELNLSLMAATMFAAGGKAAAKRVNSVLQLTTLHDTVPWPLLRWKEPHKGHHLGPKLHPT